MIPPTFNPSTSIQLARILRLLHKPGTPLLLTNIWDPPTTSLALSYPTTKAIATASFAIAASLGIEDAELTLEDNLSVVYRIAATIAKERKSESVPLTVDLQDGYGERLRDAVRKVVELGVVGVNIEDSMMRISDGDENGKGEMVLRDVEEQVERIKEVIEVAEGMGVSGFVVNARTDCVLLGNSIEDAIERGKRYLDAGATTVFVWGGMGRGLRDGEVKQLVQGLDGKLNVIYRKSLENALSVSEIAALGVARISMGPGLWREGMSVVNQEMGKGD